MKPRNQDASGSLIQKVEDFLSESAQLASFMVIYSKSAASADVSPTLTIKSRCSPPSRSSPPPAMTNVDHDNSLAFDVLSQSVELESHTLASEFSPFI